MEYILQMKDVSIHYGNHEPAVRHFSLNLKPRSIAMLVGESGSGKTTILESILGLLPGNGHIGSGDILLEGRSVLGNTEEDWRKIRGQSVTMIAQDTGAMLDPVMTIGKQFTEYLRAHENVSKQEAWETSREMLKKVRLPDPENIMNSYPFQLSGGMRQRVGIAMALAFQPKLLLADEPTSALDVTTQAQIVRQMMELRHISDAAILMITHNLALAAYMSDDIYVLKDGELVDHGSRDGILHHPKSDYTKELLAAVPALRGVRA